MEKAVITGIGCVTPIGSGVAEFAESLRSAVSGLGPLTLCDAAAFGCRVAAEVSGFDPLAFMDLREARSLPRVAQFAVAAARLGVAESGLDVREDPTRIAVVLGTSSGPLAYALEQHAIFLEKGARRTHPSAPAYAHNSVISSECAIQLGIHGPALTISSACTSGADAIGMGKLMISSDLADVVLVGGADAPLTPSLIAAFERLEMLPRNYNSDPTRASRPFDSERAGLVLGEGAAILVMESESHARARSARILAEIAGFGATSDAHSHFRQEQSGRDAERAIRAAVAMAHLDVGDIDHVNSHGTGTRENDPFEAQVLRRVMGARWYDVPVSASKSQFGHLLGASGAIEAAAAIVGMEGGFVPATLNLDHPDPACELRHVVGSPLAWKGAVCLSTSFGFGSRNAALVIKRYND